MLPNGLINSSSDSQPLKRGWFWYFGTSQGNFFSSVGTFRSAFKIGTKDFLEVGYEGGLGLVEPLGPIFSSGKWVVEDEEDMVLWLLR